MHHDGCSLNRKRKPAIGEKRISAASALQSFCLDSNDGCNLLRHLLLGPGFQLPGIRHFLQVVAKLHYNRSGTSSWGAKSPKPRRDQGGANRNQTVGNQWLPGKDCEASETIAQRTPELQTAVVEPTSLSVAQDGVVTSGVPVGQCA